MGNKCSPCLCNKNDNVLNFKKEEDDPNTEYNYIIQNLKKDTTSYKKSPLSTIASTSLDDKIKRFDEPKMIRILIKLQAVVRGYLGKRKYKKAKKYLIDQRSKMIAACQKSFMSPNRFELTYQTTYDPIGYKRYYSDKTDIFNVNYGIIVKTEIQVTELGYYTGYMNLKGKKHGYGILYKKEGSKYEGYWHNDEFTGWGRHIDQDGTLYEGKGYITNRLFHERIVKWQGRKAYDKRGILYR
jgi:hypothetical protein